MADTSVVVVAVMVWDKTTSDSSSVLSMESELLITRSGCGFEGDNGGLEKAEIEVEEWRAEGADFRALDRRTVSLESSTMCNSKGTGGEGSRE